MAPLLGQMGLSMEITPLGPLWLYGVENATARLYKRNGITEPRKQIDAIEIYEPSTWTEALFYKAMGLCDASGIKKMIRDKSTYIEGDIPVNPSGGNTSSNSLNAAGLLRSAEPAIQILGDAGDRQVPDVKTTMGVTMGGDNFATATLYKKEL